MNNSKLIEKLNSMIACEEGVDYIQNQSAKEAWENCDRGDWMLWIAQARRIDLKILTGAKVKCARLVQHLMKDQRSLDALDVAEKFSNGLATRKELNAAAYAADDAADTAAYSAADSAAYAAYAAAYAADADAYADAAAAYADDSDARKQTLEKCADICREMIPFELLNLSEY